MIVVADASAAAKLVIRETGTELMHELWDDPVSWLAPAIVVPEVASAITSAGRDGRLHGTVEDAHAAWRAVARAIEVHVVDADLASDAGAVAESHAVRGADAVYIALAQALGRDTDVVLASFDRRQRGAALDAGLSVVPRGL